MSKPTLYSIGMGIFSLGLFVLYIWLRTEHISLIRAPREFHDSTEFREMASLPITHRAFWIANKPPVTPIVYKTSGVDPARMMHVQLWVSILSWWMLATVATWLLRVRWLKPLGMILVLAFSLAQDIILWDSLILSDSLSVSFLALLTAASLALLHQWSTTRLILFSFVALLFAFTRDTNAYFLLMVAASVLLIMVLSNQRVRILLVSGILLGMFLFSNHLASLGSHWYTAFLMTVGLRILPQPDYLDYFEQRGMPVSDSLLERTGLPIQAGDENMLFDPNLAEFREWALNQGRSEFLRFLWFFKADTLQNPLRDLESTFNPDIYYYAATGFRPIIKDVRLAELLYPIRFGLFASLLANFLAMGCLYPAAQHRIKILIPAFLMILLSYPQAVLVWNADANDIARHSIHHVIMLRLGFWLLIIFMSDFIAAQYIIPLFTHYASHFKKA